MDKARATAEEATNKIDAANDQVEDEICRLDLLATATENQVERLFMELGDLLDRKKIEVVAEVKRTKLGKRQVLEGQLRDLKQERLEVVGCLKAITTIGDPEIAGRQMEELESKLEVLHGVGDPQENSFMELVRVEGELEPKVEALVAPLVLVRTSSTFPSLCRAWVEEAISSLETMARLW